MRKLRLDPEALRVETFVPEHGRGGPGTVYGHDSYPNGCLAPSGSDPAFESCGYNTCAGITCQQSCNGYTCTCDCGGGTPACPSSGPTNCVEMQSCVNQCIPTGLPCL